MPNSLSFKAILSTTIVIFCMHKIIVVFHTDLHKMKIKHRIIGEYATKRCFFRYKKADHRYWKLINYSLT
jgi:hypothetical protein